MEVESSIFIQGQQTNAHQDLAGKVNERDTGQVGIELTEGTCPFLKRKLRGISLVGTVPVRGRQIPRCAC